MEEEYRIVRTEPSLAVVLVHDGSEWRKIYNGMAAAVRDLALLKAAYPDMEFEIVDHVYLEV